MPDILNSSQTHRTMERKHSMSGQSEAPTKITSHCSEGSTISPEAELNASMLEQCEISDKLRASERECKQLQGQIVKLRAKLGDSEKICGELQAQLLDLEKQRTEITDFVFSLHRREEKITSSDAANEFHSLCVTVEDWVQSKLGNAIGLRLAERSISANNRTKLLLNIILKSGRDAFNYPDTDECNVYAAVMRFLCIKIFDEDFYCPISPGAMEFLTSIEKSMRNLDPPRGQLYILGI